MTARRLTGTAILEGLIDHARTLHFWAHHETDSRKTDPGFPDLLVVGMGAIVAIETKSTGELLRESTFTKKGRYLPGQLDWLLAFASTPAYSLIVRPERSIPAEEILIYSEYGRVIEVGYEDCLAFLSRLREEYLARTNLLVDTGR